MKLPYLEFKRIREFINQILFQNSQSIYHTIKCGCLENFILSTPFLKNRFAPTYALFRKKGRELWKWSPILCDMVSARTMYSKKECLTVHLLSTTTREFGGINFRPPRICVLSLRNTKRPLFHCSLFEREGPAHFHIHEFTYTNWLWAFVAD